MRKFLLPILFASAVLTAYVVTTGLVPTAAIGDSGFLIIAGFSAIAAVPLYLIGHHLDITATQQREKRQLERAAVKRMQAEARKHEADADAAELHREHLRAGQFDDDLIAPKSNGRGIGFGFS